MPRRAAAHRVTDVAGAFVSFLSRHQADDSLDLARTVCPYRAPHLVNCWLAGWLAHDARPILGEGYTAPGLSALARRAWLRGYEARDEVVTHTQPQEG